MATINETSGNPTRSFYYNRLGKGGQFTAGVFTTDDAVLAQTLDDEPWAQWDRGAGGTVYDYEGVLRRSDGALVLETARTPIALPGGGSAPDATASVKGILTLGATGGAARHEAVLFKPTSTVVTNLGATRTLDVNVSNEKSLVGVLNTDLTLTLINFSIGSRADLWFTQGDPGGWDVTLAADGHGSQLLEGVNQAAGSENHIEIYFDGTNFRVDVN